MADVFSIEKRSRIMAGVHGKNTTPELVVRSMLHRLGYRFRLHRSDLPGKPDIVLPRYHKVIFVHGCFWHGHNGCGRSKRPTTNVEFWNKKIDSNIERDEKSQRELQNSGWDCLVVWECEIRHSDDLKEKLLGFMRH